MYLENYNGIQLHIWIASTSGIHTMELRIFNYIFDNGNICFDFKDFFNGRKKVILLCYYVIDIIVFVRVIGIFFTLYINVGILFYDIRIRE